MFTAHSPLKTKFPKQIIELTITQTQIKITMTSEYSAKVIEASLITSSNPEGVTKRTPSQCQAKHCAK